MNTGGQFRSAFVRLCSVRSQRERRVSAWQPRVAAPREALKFRLSGRKWRVTYPLQGAYKCDRRIDDPPDPEGTPKNLPHNSSRGGKKMTDSSTRTAHSAFPRSGGIMVECHVEGFVFWGLAGK